MSCHSCACVKLKSLDQLKNSALHCALKSVRFFSSELLQFCFKKLLYWQNADYVCYSTCIVTFTFGCHFFWCLYYQNSLCQKAISFIKWNPFSLYKLANSSEVVCLVFLSLILPPVDIHGTNSIKNTLSLRKPKNVLLSMCESDFCHRSLAVCVSVTEFCSMMLV